METTRVYRDSTLKYALGQVNIGSNGMRPPWLSPPVCTLCESFSYGSFLRNKGAPI